MNNPIDFNIYKNYLSLIYKEVKVFYDEDKYFSKLKGDFVRQKYAKELNIKTFTLAQSIFKLLKSKEIISVAILMRSFLESATELCLLRNYNDYDLFLSYYNYKNQIKFLKRLGNKTDETTNQVNKYEDLVVQLVNDIDKIRTTISLIYFDANRKLINRELEKPPLQKNLNDFFSNHEIYEIRNNFELNQCVNHIDTNEFKELKKQLRQIINSHKNVLKEPDLKKLLACCNNLEIILKDKKNNSIFENTNEIYKQIKTKTSLQIAPDLPDIKNTIPDLTIKAKIYATASISLYDIAYSHYSELVHPNPEISAYYSNYPNFNFKDTCGLTFANCLQANINFIKILLENCLHKIRHDTTRDNLEKLCAKIQNALNLFKKKNNIPI